jgi:hypothetical protein
VIIVRGTREHGVTLADVRRFVKETEHMRDDVYVDCEIPSQTSGRFQVAALMGLQA